MESFDNKEFLDELLSFFHVINRFNRAIRQAEDEDVTLALSSIQVQALIVIRHHGILNMSQLANHLLVTKPQLTKVVDALVALHLVQRRPDEDNRRLVLVELSEKGNRYMDETILGQDSVLARSFRSISQEEAEELTTAAHTVRDILSKLRFD